MMMVFKATQKISIWVMILLVLNCIAPSLALAENSVLEKAGRGVINIVTAPVEIPKEVRAHWIAGSEKTYHILVWIGCGLVKGSVMTIARIGSGTWDVLTFPLSVPGDYAPLLRPAYVFDEWPQRKEGVVYKQLGDK